MDGDKLKTPKAALRGKMEPLLSHPEDDVSENGDDSFQGQKSTIATISTNLRKSLFGAVKRTRSKSESNGAASMSPLVRFFTIGNFITQAITYSAPNLLPYMVVAYQGHESIYNNMNRMYNLGQMIGSVFFRFVPSYSPQELHIFFCFIVFSSTFAMICISSA